jgi:drug/metabolite transporter (DMT)-like permease
LLVSIAFRNATNHQITIYIRDPVLRNKVYFRAFLGAVTAVGLYYGIQLISLSETVILGKTSPLWTALITIYILR